MLNESTQLSRRNFLKAGAAATAAASLGGSIVALASNEVAIAENVADAGVREYMCKCTGICLGMCTHKVHVKDGKAFNITKHELPDPRWESICQRGLTQLQRLYDPHRIKYPMRRVEGTARGAGEWERISWDDAFDEIETKWKAYRQEFGNESIAFFTDSANVRPDVSYGERLPNFMGATVLRNSYDGNGNFNSPRLFGAGGRWHRGNDWRSVRDAKNIVIWACNPTDSIAIRWRWVMDAQENGAKITVIDPTFTTAASKADAFYPIRPGSDGYLALAIVNDIVSNGLCDAAALQTKTVAPFLVKDDGMFLRKSDLGQAQPMAEDDAIVVRTGDGSFVAAELCQDPVLTGTFDANGLSVTTAFDLLTERASEYSYEKAAEYCDLTPEQIQEIAALFKESPTTVISSYAIDKYSNAMSFYTSVAALLMVSGNIAKPGAGYVDGYCSMPLGISGYGAYMLPGEPQGSNMMWDVCAYENIVEGKDYIQGQKPPTIKSLYIWASNMIVTQPCRRRTLELLDNIEFVVVADVLMNETASYADLVLPVPHYYELEGYANNHPFTCINEAAVEPAFECMGDFEIMSELGRRMGYEEEFALTREEFLNRAFADPASEMFGITWDKLKEEKAIFAFDPNVFVMGKDEPYPTSTGRAQFFIEGVRPVPDRGQTDWDWHKEALPYWEPPVEAWYESEAAQKYPIHFYQKHGKFKVHSQYTYAPTLLEIESEPIVYLTLANAQERGIAAGDLVRIFNDRGSVVCRAQIHGGMRDGMAAMSHGWDGSQYIEGHMQDLTPSFYSTYISAPCFFDTQVEIEKYEGSVK